MNRRDDFDLLLASVLEEMAPPRVPAYLESVKQLPQHRSQRSTWAFPAHWLGLDVTAQSRVPSRLIVPAVIVLLVLVALAAAALIGSQHRLPAPFGPARNGVIVFDDGAHVLAGGPGTTSTALTSGSSTDTLPSVSLDGRQLAFIRQAPGRTALVIAEIDGSREVELVVAKDAEGRTIKPEPPAWSPDGRHVLVTLLEGASAERHALLWIADADDGSAMTLLPPGLASAEAPAWSPTGDRIAFLGQRSEEEASYLYVIGADGSGLVRISPTPSDADAGYLQLPRWSPDGRQIAVHHGDSAKLNRDILVIAADGSGEEIVAGTPRDEAQPAWSPDGGSLAYWRSDGGREWQVVVLDVQTRVDRVVGPSSGDADSLGWSPDGTGIVTVTCINPTSCELRLIDAMDPRAPPLVIATVGPKSYDLSTDQVYWSWQRLAP